VNLVSLQKYFLPRESCYIFRKNCPVILDLGKKFRKKTKKQEKKIKKFFAIPAVFIHFLLGNE
jgi:hypothetical protein